MTSASVTLDSFVCAAAKHWAHAPRRRIQDVAIYLAHVEGALSLRTVSKACGKSLATVHRAVRRIEALRDDPLIDRSVEIIGKTCQQDTDFSKHSLNGQTMSSVDMMTRTRRRIDSPHPAETDASLRDNLETLSQKGAFLLVANGAERAGIFARSNNFRRPVALLSLDHAADLAARDWVRCVSRSGVSSKYVATPAILRWLCAGRDGAEQPEARRGRWRCTVGKPARLSVIEALARRRGRDGVQFLSSAALAAAQRFCVDSERASGLAAEEMDWRETIGVSGQEDTGHQNAACTAARQRVAEALNALGPGLADIVAAVCGKNEGLEAVESRMGWSPRSAKVVLAIALDRLALHYGIEN